MSDDLEYKGYRGSVEYSREDRMFFGKVLFIDSLLIYHGTSVDEIEQAFKETVDRYLEHCRKTGKTPNKPYSGSFNVRVGPERHAAAAQLAYRRGCSLNELICRALDRELERAEQGEVVNHHHEHKHVLEVSVRSSEQREVQDFTTGGMKWPSKAAH
ncbi:MAG: type II toxin-antitoxin system HicB family antitoxin [Pseudomonadota bacterium]